MQYSQRGILALKRCQFISGQFTGLFPLFTVGTLLRRLCDCLTEEPDYVDVGTNGRSNFNFSMSSRRFFKICPLSFFSASPPLDSLLSSYSSVKVNSVSFHSCVMFSYVSQPHCCWEFLLSLSIHKGILAPYFLSPNYILYKVFTLPSFQVPQN